MAGESINIGHHQRTGFLPGRTTDAPPLADARTGHRPLKGSQHQFLARHPIETYPKETERFLQGSRHIGQIGHFIGFTRQKSLKLRKQGLVAFFLRAATDIQIFCHNMN